MVISRSLLVIRLFSTKTGTSDNNTKFNQLSIKWNMLFSSDILDQFVKRDLFSMKEVVICLFPTFFPWRLVFVPGEIIIGLATINKTAFYHLIFLNGEIWSWNFSLIGSQLNLIDICCQPLRHIINTEKESAYQQQRAWTFGCCVSKFSLLRNL